MRAMRRPSAPFELAARSEATQVCKLRLAGDDWQGDSE